MGSKALTNDKRLAKLIYKSVLKSANKKYPANVRLDVMLEFIDSLKVTLEGLINKQAEKEQKDKAVTISAMDITKLDEPRQAIEAEEEPVSEEPAQTVKNTEGLEIPVEEKTKSKQKSKKSKGSKKRNKKS